MCPSIVNYNTLKKHEKGRIKYQSSHIRSIFWNKRVTNILFVCDNVFKLLSLQNDRTLTHNFPVKSIFLYSTIQNIFFGFLIYSFTKWFFEHI